MKLNQRGAVLPTVLILSIILISLSASHQVLILGRMRQLNLLKESYELQTMEAMALEDYLASSEGSQNVTYVFNKGNIQVDWQADDKLVLIANHKEGLSRQTEYEMGHPDLEISQDLEKEEIEEISEESEFDHEKMIEKLEETDCQIEESSYSKEESAASQENQEAESIQTLRPEEVVENPD